MHEKAPCIPLETFIDGIIFFELSQLSFSQIDLFLSYLAICISLKYFHDLLFSMELILKEGTN